MKATQTMRLIPLMSLVVLIGCTSTDLYPVSGSYAKINQMQILDPMAPENNAGIVNDLDGNYGKEVITSYQKSNYEPKDGRASKNASRALTSGKSN